MSVCTEEYFGISADAVLQALARGSTDPVIVVSPRKDFRVPIHTRGLTEDQVFAAIERRGGFEKRWVEGVRVVGIPVVPVKLSRHFMEGDMLPVPLEHASADFVAAILRRELPELIVRTEKEQNFVILLPRNRETSVALIIAANALVELLDKPSDASGLQSRYTSAN